MAKLTNVRERVHQPFRDTLIRTSGMYASSVQDRTDLFTQAGKDDGQSNLKNGSTLPSDQSMVVLALRVFTWFRASVARGGTTACGTSSILEANGDYAAANIACDKGTPTQAASTLNGQAVGDYHDVYRLHYQAEEQLLWSFGSGQKFSLTSMPTAYFPYGGGLAGWMNGRGGGSVCCEVAIVDGGGNGNVSVAGKGCCQGTILVDTVYTPPLDLEPASYTWTVTFIPAVGDPITLLAGDDTSAFGGATVPVPGCGEFSIKLLYPEGRASTTWSVTPCGASGGNGDTIHWSNGTPDHTGILRLARAILLPPRQNVLCQAQIVRLPDGGNGGTFGVNQGSRDMLSLTSNLNAVDLVQKVVSFTFDGLFSRDVQ